MQGTIKPAKLADAIAEHLEKLILEGALRPGEKLLAERELAAKLDVSRPSLRDAIAKLEERGLLVTGRNGTHIAQFLSHIGDPLVALLQNNPKTTFDYLEFRRSIEAQAAMLAAQRATDLDHAQIRGIVARMKAAHGKDDSSEEADSDADLHLAIYEAAHNIVMLHIMRTLSEMLRNDVFYNRADLYSRQGVRDLLLAQHLEIADAVLAGDPVRAHAAAEAHVEYTLKTLREIRENDARLEVSLRRIGRTDLIDTAG